MPRDGTFTKPDTEIAALLRKAKALIDTPEKWCQGVCARDRNGVGVLTDGGLAVSRCAMGAIWAVSRAGRCDWFLHEAARQMFGADCAADVNDTTDHPTVMRMFDLAIEMAREEG